MKTTARSKSGALIRLSEERWEHIVRRHPEMANQRERILETISDPDLVQEGDFGELLAIKFFRDTPLSEKFLVVVYKETGERSGLVFTAYFTSRPSRRRRVIWMR